MYRSYLIIFVATQLFCRYSVASAEYVVPILRDPSPVQSPDLEVISQPETKINTPVSLPQNTVDTKDDLKTKVTGSSSVTVTLPEITGDAKVAEEQQTKAEIIPSEPKLPATDTSENPSSKLIEALVISDISSKVVEPETQASEIVVVSVAPNEIVPKESSTVKIPTKKTKNTEVPDEVIVHRPSHSNTHAHTPGQNSPHPHAHSPGQNSPQSHAHTQGQNSPHPQVVALSQPQPNKGQFHQISAIPPNPLSSPANGGTLILPNSGDGKLGGYTYGAGSGSAEIAADDKAQAQIFGWAEGGSNLSPEITGAGGQFGGGGGVALNTDVVTASLGVSVGGSTGLGFAKPSGDHGHQGHQGHEGPGVNIFGFLQQLPAQFSSLTTAGSGGYDRLQTVAKPGTPGSGRPEINKEDSPKPPTAAPTGLFGLLTPFSSLSSAILSDDDPEDSGSAESGEKQQPLSEAPSPFFGGFFPSTASGGLMGLFRPLESLTGLTEGTVTISGGAKVTPFLPFLNKPLCPEALEVCINACHDVGKHGGVLGHGNKCFCSCRVPEKFSGGNLCDNKYTSHCNKFCKTNHIHSYESGHCNSASGHCECKCPLGKPCFGGGSGEHYDTIS